MSRMTKKTMVLDDTLLAAAQAACGGTTKTATVHEGLQALVRRASTARLIALAGSQPHATAPPRRRQGRITARSHSKMPSRRRA